MSNCNHIITNETVKISPNFTGVVVYENKKPIQEAEADVTIRYYVNGVEQACTYYTVVPRTKVTTECVFERTGALIGECTRTTKKYAEVLLCTYDKFGEEMDNVSDAFIAEE